ncbi:methyltransferase domain-containing protein [Kaustia mangrovi]|uniref:Methyltransferase domain-containing protein n=1 Tax=Kaustia mangrovi TaxID=2593653 RepID=A0A7S8C2D1_9HYPH|nr:methyltransferase domain-containing protein [Kaustia mangrovi]QPC42098.1 methyltransferase domain-containing protein [Kaustia mangrovi]
MTAADPGRGTTPDGGGEAAGDELTEDGFLGGRLRILQPKKGYRAGIDAVFLAAAVPCEAGDRVLEAGLGTGVPALCLLARAKGVHVTGVEISPYHAGLARDNAARNGFADALDIVEGDMREITRARHRDRLMPGSFRHVFANPPYFELGRVQSSPRDHKRTAHAMAAGDLESWIRAMTAMAAPRGTVTLIHRADSLGAILAGFARRAGDVRVLPLFPRDGEPASRVIVQAVKGSRAGTTLLQGLVLHGPDNGFTPAAEAVLRHGAALDVA